MTLEKISLGAENNSSRLLPIRIEMEDLSPCCKQTIRTFVINNPMVSCHVCKHIIKCFTDKTAYYNFARFCQLKRRKVRYAELDGYFIIFFPAFHQ